MSWASVASEILTTTAFVFADSSFHDLVRNELCIYRRPRNSPVPETKKVSVVEGSLITNAEREALDRSHMILRATLEAYRRGPGVEGLRQAFKEQGLDHDF